MIEAVFEVLFALLVEVIEFVIFSAVIRVVWAVMVAVGWRRWVVIAGLGTGLYLAITFLGRA